MNMEAEMKEHFDKLETLIGKTADGHARLETLIGKTTDGQARLETLIGKTTDGQARLETLIGKTTDGHARLETLIGKTTDGHANLERLIVDVKESLETEMQSGFSALNTKLDDISIRLDRHAGLLRSGGQRIVRLDDWAEKVDKCLEANDHIGR